MNRCNRSSYTKSELAYSKLYINHDYLRLFPKKIQNTKRTISKPRGDAFTRKTRFARQRRINVCFFRYLPALRANKSENRTVYSCVDTRTLVGRAFGRTALGRRTEKREEKAGAEKSLPGRATRRIAIISRFFFFFLLSLEETIYGDFCCYALAAVFYHFLEVDPSGRGFLSFCHGSFVTPRRNVSPFTVVNENATLSMDNKSTAVPCPCRLIDAITAERIWYITKATSLYIGESKLGNGNDADISVFCGGTSRILGIASVRTRADKFTAKLSTKERNVRIVEYRR